ncbi:uracil-DNA glycosylase [Salinisphaera sp. LB1]|uniref:uracil-DNA glycosylase n=1 Tax=Salinisphaera sp. LB1 TaxID=2183911 RepID=UPI000D7DB5D7|nr:uracil-DNA glycosylase [Salinisphaera sp. LB1]AWN16874.1 Uracil-DNA glycosylase, family 4 [Salinisphaera sp. LB1]
MTSDARRDDYLRALGLADWQYRADGPLGGARARPGKALEPGMTGSNEAAAVVAAGDEQTVAAPEREVAAPAPASLAREPEADAAPAPTPDADTGPAGLDWDGLEAYLARQDHRGASRPVFGIGARDAEVLIVGEAPGASEDAQGVPFVGRAGKLLDRMLAAIDCSRATNVYITNICKFRPPDNRDPTPDEVAADWPILERQIDLMAPRLVVAVGRVAAQTLLACQTPLGKLRGRLHRYPRRDLDVLVTYHPAFLLRSPQQKSKAWADLKMIARHIRSFER